MRGKLFNFILDCCEHYQSRSDPATCDICKLGLIRYIDKTKKQFAIKWFDFRSDDKDDNLCSTYHYDVYKENYARQGVKTDAKNLLQKNIDRKLSDKKIKLISVEEDGLTIYEFDSNFNLPDSTKEGNIVHELCNSSAASQELNQVNPGAAGSGNQSINMGITGVPGYVGSVVPIQQNHTEPGVVGSQNQLTNMRITGVPGYEYSVVPIQQSPSEPGVVGYQNQLTSMGITGVHGYEYSVVPIQQSPSEPGVVGSQNQLTNMRITGVPGYEYSAVPIQQSPSEPGVVGYQNQLTNMGITDVTGYEMDTDSVTCLQPIPSTSRVPGDNLPSHFGIQSSLPMSGSYGHMQQYISNAPVVPQQNGFPIGEQPVFVLENTSWQSTPPSHSNFVAHTLVHHGDNFLKSEEFVLSPCIELSTPDYKAMQELQLASQESRTDDQWTGPRATPEKFHQFLHTEEEAGFDLNNEIRRLQFSGGDWGKLADQKFMESRFRMRIEVFARLQPQGIQKQVYAKEAKSKGGFRIVSHEYVEPLTDIARFGPPGANGFALDDVKMKPRGQVSNENVSKCLETFARGAVVFLWKSYEPPESNYWRVPPELIKELCWRLYCYRICKGYQSEHGVRMLKMCVQMNPKKPENPEESCQELKIHEFVLVFDLLRSYLKALQLLNSQERRNGKIENQLKSYIGLRSTSKADSNELPMRLEISNSNLMNMFDYCGDAEINSQSNPSEPDPFR